MGATNVIANPCGHGRDGLTILEAAELLGLNASTARSRYAAARAQLREALTVATTRH